MTRRLQLAGIAAALLIATAPLAAQYETPAPAAPSAAATAPAAAGTDTAALLAHLERTRSIFLAEIAGLSPAQWSWKPAPDRWSVAECAEHITRTERFLREILVEKVKPTADAELLAKSNGKADTVLAMITDRTQRFNAPEPVNPSSNAEIRSREEILRDFNFERGRTVQHVSTAGDPTASAGVHGAFQELDLAGWIYFQSGHTERHTLQIREVKATAGFPAS
jgi:hypothetical protein